MRRNARRSFAVGLIWMGSCLPIAVTPAGAQQKLSLEVTVPAPTLPSDLFKPNGQPTEFIGVGLGQKIDDIRKILTAQNLANEDSSARFLLDEEYYAVEIIATGPNRFPTYIIWSGPDDPVEKQSVRVEFSSPLSGQRSTNVRRFVTYKGAGGPSVGTLRKAIIDKYGPPSTDNKTKMIWLWAHDQLVRSGAYDKQMTIAMQAKADVVSDVVYDLVDGEARDKDRDRINEFQKSVEDAAKKVRDQHAAAPKL
ncbi:hypothetical protein RFN25_27170 [Mesorhizobium abyssinicae]|uniref:hypothetical protein n=1 Tax=Mesorhizobium abyssinicae TaxID=1209958 RepID=UPI002A24AF65|nr:hypothetical protein [Mesorhizobium abyssinicae]MDX8437113.1 hypothetical protein [Mesorhizobium abyssinicae]